MLYHVLHPQRNLLKTSILNSEYNFFFQLIFIKLVPFDLTNFVLKHT